VVERHWLSILIYRPRDIETTSIDVAIAHIVNISIPEGITNPMGSIAAGIMAITRQKGTLEA
jgi:hypothetical protein